MGRIRQAEDGGGATGGGDSLRFISRCLSVLQAINRPGAHNIMEIAQQAKIPYATTHRIVHALIHEGFVEREPARRRYRPTALVQSLSQGFQNHDALVAAGRSHIVRFTETHLWPVAIMTRVGQNLVVRDSTHTLTSLVLSNYYPGYIVPIMGSAAGRAWLAFSPEAERDRLLTTLRGTPQYETDDAVDLIESGALLEEIRSNGYATKLRNRYIENPGKTSSIAAPIFDTEQLAGVLILSYFTSAMTLAQASATLAPPLMETAKSIGQSLPGRSD